MSNLATKIKKNSARALERFIKEYEEFLAANRDIHTQTPLGLAELARQAGIVPINPQPLPADQESKQSWAMMTYVPCRIPGNDHHYKNLTIGDAVEYKGHVIALRNLPVCNCETMMAVQAIAALN